MKLSFGLLHETRNHCKLQIETDTFECETDWFLETNPSINDTHLFLPEWEDKNDLGWVAMYFINETYNELLQNNDALLCEDAKIFLEKFKEMREKTQSYEEESNLQMRKLVENLLKQNSGL